MTTSFGPFVRAAASEAALSHQLDLFPDEPERPHAVSVSRPLARAQVSAGWWPQIAPLFDMEFSSTPIVTDCREEDGALLLEATSPGDEDWLPPLLERIRAAVERTCGCCGSGSAQSFRASLDTPTRRVCHRCRAHLRNGLSYLRVADLHFHLDGSRRVPPLLPPSSALVKSAHPTASRRPCETLRPDELRRVIAEMRDGMRTDITGHDRQIAELALVGAMHVGGGLSRGARVLLLGHSGVGKSELARSLARQLSLWDIPPVVHVNLNELVSSGWHGTSIPDLLTSALGSAPADGEWAQRMVVILDEVHHAAIAPNIDGNSLKQAKDLLSSVLSLGHGTTVLTDGRVWSSQRALVLSIGAFSGLLSLERPPSIGELARSGIPVEVSTRLAEQVILLRALSEPDLVHMLRQWPALTSLAAVCERLGFRVRILDEAYRRAARVVTLGHDESTARTAGGWLVSALRHALIEALCVEGSSELVIAPDSLPIPTTATRPLPPDDPLEPGGPWDTTFVIRPRR